MSLKIRQAQKNFEEGGSLSEFKNRISKPLPKTEISIDIESIKALTGTCKWRLVEEPVQWCVFTLLADTPICQVFNTIYSGFLNGLSDEMSKEVAAEEMQKLVVSFAQEQGVIYGESKVTLSREGKVWKVLVSRDWNSITDIGYGIDPDKLKGQLLNML